MIAISLAACGADKTDAPTYHAKTNPERLSDWGMFSVKEDALVLSEGVKPYDLATPLFSDYALKLRTVWTPGGAPAEYKENDPFDFPVGAVVTKTFYYPAATADWTGAVTYGPRRTTVNGRFALDGYRLVETRVLVHRDDGWAALPYVWNEEQTDAVLKRAGAVMPLTLYRPDGGGEDFAYVVPDANQCAACHATNATTKEIAPIGLKARHLNKPSSFIAGVNQLEEWARSGLLAGEFRGAGAAPQNADWTDAEASLDARARAYLDVNCSHCHNPVGPADSSGLNLEPDASGPALGFCKSPIAAGSGTGGRPFDFVPGAPDQSITLYRMETNDPAAMMPELGRAVVHDEGVALIAKWVTEMDGDCG